MKKVNIIYIRNNIMYQKSCRIDDKLAISKQNYNEFIYMEI